MLEKILCFLSNKTKNTDRHRLCGMLSGTVGIICNLFLCSVKFLVGTLSHSISITADAVNNLSDAASNIITIVGTRISGKPVDKEHPFGHGRAEYISGLAVAFLIMLMGFELGTSSIEKIISPEKLKFSPVYLLVLLFSVAVKLFMAFFNHKLYKATGNLNLKAVRQDSLNDCLSTFSAAIALTAGGFFKIYWLDGVIGLAVAAFILISGIGIIKEIMDFILGKAPDKDFTDKIIDIITENEKILGVHDLIVHDYGHGKIIASAHAEVPSTIDIVTIHEIIDTAEHRIDDELGVCISIHIDPVDVENLLMQTYRDTTEDIIARYNPEYSIHDFRIKKSNGKECLCFDVVIPFYDEKNKVLIENDIVSIIKEQIPNIEVSANFEHSYT